MRLLAGDRHRVARALPVCRRPSAGQRVRLPDSVTLTTARPRRAAAVQRLPAARRGAPRAAGASPEIQNVVVYLKDVAFAGALPPARQRDRAGARDLRAARAGRHARIDGRRSRTAIPIFHNVFSLSERGDLRSRALSAGPDARSSTFTKAGPRQGLLPHPLAHERDDHGARPSVLHDARRWTASSRCRTSRPGSTRSSAGTSASASAAAPIDVDGGGDRVGRPVAAGRGSAMTRRRQPPRAPGQDAHGHLRRWSPLLLSIVFVGGHAQRARPGAPVGRRQPRIEPAACSRRSRRAASATCGRRPRRWPKARRSRRRSTPTRPKRGRATRPDASSCSTTITRELDKVAARVEADAIVAGRRAAEHARGRRPARATAGRAAGAVPLAAGDGRDRATASRASAERYVPRRDRPAAASTTSEIGTLYLATSLDDDATRRSSTRCRARGSRSSADGRCWRRTLSAAPRAGVRSVARRIDAAGRRPSTLDGESYAFRRLVQLGDTSFYALGSIDEPSRARDAARDAQTLALIAIGAAPARARRQLLAGAIADARRSASCRPRSPRMAATRDVDGRAAADRIEPRARHADATLQRPDGVGRRGRSADARRPTRAPSGRWRRRSTRAIRTRPATPSASACCRSRSAARCS